MRPVTRAAKSVVASFEGTVRSLTIGWIHPAAYEFYNRLEQTAFRPNAHIDVLPLQRIIYVCVPKNASSRIKMSLSRLLGRTVLKGSDANRRRLSGLRSPKQVGLSCFYELTNDPGTLRFGFVRNPYSRLFSCWADKFRNVPLTAQNRSVSSYLEWRDNNDRSLPAGPMRTLSFHEFIEFATLTASERVDAHWHLQSNLLDMPGILLNFIGRVENFATDFATVLDFAGASDALRIDAYRPINQTANSVWWHYYGGKSAQRVAKAYEADFDRFGYPTRPA